MGKSLGARFLWPTLYTQASGMPRKSATCFCCSS